LKKFPGIQGHQVKGTFIPISNCFRSRCADLSFAPKPRRKNLEVVMLGWVVTFLIIALIAGILGFGGIAGASIEIAKIIFFIAVVLFLVSAVIGLSRGRTRI
jgi:uncharacterized membrane protein YtjA (UPF0391 family)